ncbi:Ubiquitin-like modifier-activating enzyme atg7 [Diplonema papillatum]|nr:Ubiquitin-like modifier-activating enzyme atg7 [Diplonema papillatum]
MPELQTAAFEKFSSAQKIEFWFELVRKKRDEMRLSTDEVPLTGFFRTSKSRCGSGSDHRKVEFTMESFKATPQVSDFEFPLPGGLVNFNTIEEYAAMNATELSRKHATHLWRSICSGEWLATPALLYRFALYSFADLKQYIFKHRTILSILAPTELIQQTPLQPISSFLSPSEVSSFTDELDVVRGLADGAPAGGSPLKHCPVFLVRRLTESGSTDPTVALHPLSTLQRADAAGLAAGQFFVACADTCGAAHFGWVARNLLVALGLYFGFKEVTLVSLREDPAARSIASSAAAKFVLPACLPDGCPPLPEDAASLELPSYLKPVGWESQKPDVNLKATMDPVELAEESSQLNLRLMKWRAVPALDLDLIAKQKCLLVGSGTLGCGVARNLMKWGITNITFLDSGMVSHSNTVRQNLFEHKDAAEGRPKAQAAAEACKRIYPKAKTDWRVMRIPMPGHAISKNEEADVQKTTAEFETLVQENDVVFLLTDSREGRWLPTLLGAVHDKLVMNAALGFEGYVAMRHGCPSTDKADRVGCYFCTDVASPADSMRDRTLDQQCTVTRPGVSDMACALIVELMVSTLTHPAGKHAPAPRDDGPQGCLGNAPHQIRGGLTFFDQATIRGESFEKCVACSPPVIDEFKRRGFAFLLDVFNDPKGSVLANVSGIQEMLDAIDHADFAAIDSDE